MKRWSKWLQGRRQKPSLARSPASKSIPHLLPQEIVDIIIDLLSLCPQSLSTCALVCNFWVPRVRHNQFTTLTIRGSAISEFVELLSSPSSTLLECTTTLEIGTETSRWTPSESIYGAISNLRCLKTLKLCYFDIVTEEMPGLGTLGDTCHRLDCVEILNGSFREGHQFLQMLCLFSKVRHRKWSNKPTFALKDVPKNCFSSRMKGYLKLEYGTEPNFVEWLCLQVPRPSIDDLSLPTCGPVGGRLLMITGASLKTLQLKLQRFGTHGYNARRSDEKEFFQSIDLSHNPNLRSLKITDIFFECGSNRFQHILRLLGQVRSAPLVELLFEVTVTDVQHFGQVPWDHLWDIVEKQGPQLEKMTIVLSVLDRRTRKKLTEEGKQEMQAIVRGRGGRRIEEKVTVDFLEN